MRNAQYAQHEDHHRLVDAGNDVALILYPFASKLETEDLKHLSIEDIFDCVAATQDEVHGAYSAVTIIANHGLLAFCDPDGSRPLVMGRQVTEVGVSWAFASETTCLDHLDFEVVRDLEPGEAVFIDQDQRCTAASAAAGSRPCSNTSTSPGRTRR